MAAITLLASGAQAASGTSTPLATDAYSQLRLTIALVTDLGQDPDVSVSIQTGPTASGPFREAVAKRFNNSHAGYQDGYAPPIGSYTVTVGDVDLFTRCVWQATVRKNSASGAPNLTLGVTGTGQ